MSTENDTTQFDLDEAVLLQCLDVNPGMVKAGSVSVQFVEGKAVAQYTMIRAIPPRMLGVALLQAAKQQDQPAEPVEPVEPIDQPAGMPPTLAAVPSVAPPMPEGDDPRAGEPTEQPGPRRKGHRPPRSTE